MKKLLWSLVIVVILIFGGYKIAENTIMGGTTYYTKITTDGQKKIEREQNRELTTYLYTLPGYTKEGAEKTLEFQGMQPRPLKKNAYLKLTWNKKKGVTAYEEVQKADIPKKAVEKLEGE